VPYADERATATQSQVAVRGRELARQYGQGDTVVHALRGVDIDVTPARLTAVMGPSGSGKSTLMHILAGHDEPDGPMTAVSRPGVTSMSTPRRAWTTVSPWP
jgi:putative ABC transport system ATP-binding protein